MGDPDVVFEGPHNPDAVGGWQDHCASEAIAEGRGGLATADKPGTAYAVQGQDVGTMQTLGEGGCSMQCGQVGEVEVGRVCDVEGGQV